MKTTKIKVTTEDLDQITAKFDAQRVDATTEADIAKQMQADAAEAMQDAAEYVRNVRKRLGLSQVELSRRIHVSTETLRNWEQGKRQPTGAAKALFQILDKAPEAALHALA